MKQSENGARPEELFMRNLSARKRGSNFNDKWHIDETRIKIKGEIFWLWRLIDAEGKKI